MKKKLTTETPSEVQIMRDKSDMNTRDVFSISLKSATKPVDDLIKKAIDAVKQTEIHHTTKPEQEWIR